MWWKIILGIVIWVFFPGLAAVGIALLLLWGWLSPEEDTAGTGDTGDEDNRIYPDGTRRTPNASNTGYYYTNGTKEVMTSWTDVLGNEHRSNGEVVMDNAFIPGQRDIYRDGQCVGHEYEDAAGITRRR